MLALSGVKRQQNMGW